jgi:hypothetical protein
MAFYAIGPVTVNVFLREHAAGVPDGVNAHGVQRHT